MTHDAISRATWRMNSASTMILKCRVKDGSDVLATIEKFHYLKWQWSAQFQTGFAKTRHTAMRRARKALR